MKKTLIFALVFMLTVVNSSVVFAEDISTDLTQVQAGGEAPVVKAKWEMNPEKGNDGQYLGTDDSTSAGAQFNPTGVKDLNKRIAICAIVTDPEGMGDVAGVYADVYYPEGIALGPSHDPLANQSGAGCGEFMQQDKLTELTKEEGFELFCKKIKDSNNNLPVFNGTTYDYDEICAQDGELLKMTARVYCAEKDLSYEDPFGHYKVIVQAQDTNSLNGTLENSFEYLPLTAFVADFTSVGYGNVKLNIEKLVNGDLNFGTSALPTVRNVGNTRLNMTVLQNDMGLGKTSGSWNVSYKARVGSYAEYTPYLPEVTATLEDALDLSETDEIDFSILVNKFPTSSSNNWHGSMTLGAVSAPHLACASKVGAKLSAYVAPTNCDFTVNAGESIQTALNSATTGQTVCVAAGTHSTPDTYPLMMNTAGVTLAGLGNAGDAVLSGGVSVNANNMTITGLTIHDSNITGEVFGVYLNAGTTGATVSYNKLIGPGVATGSGLINVYASGNAGLMFTNNESTNWKRGIFLNPSSNMTVEYNTLTGNSVGSANDFPSGNMIRRNQITGNSSEGVGTLLGATDSITVTENNIYGNGGVGNELNNYAANPVSAENNWWGDLTPADEIGDVGAAQVNFTPWATSAYALN
ncbi:hypothetical protein GYA13_00300 [Candidatus Kuenenbacteria bacterium]|nr:hypothetical protein [Candidatus Kuenenbacteria bacterium]